MKKNTIDNVTKNTLTLTGITRYIFNFTVLYLLFRGRCFLDYTVYVNPNRIKKQSWQSDEKIIPGEASPSNMAETAG